MDKDEQAQIIVDKLWTLLGDERLEGKSVYEAARSIGANEDLAQRVSELWDGPDQLK